ncbi:MAG TPA: L-2-hydroxyglutarate oxidase [Solirubrobacteraceae bacterium]|nr:L-2-hydroxyglutarate oxidase [Solirubrobacteraceae bacterium]
MQEPPPSCDVAVVGGGIVGLAVARELARGDVRRRVCLLEREVELALHQTARNSGVVHAGIYYRPGSAKARLCVAGSRLLLAYAEERGLPAVRCGKLIVAADARELPALDELERRGHANGVAGLRRLAAGELADVEPHARGVAALHSPASAVADFRALALSFADDVREAGGAIATGCAVTAQLPRGRELVLTHSRGELAARHAVFCGGAWSGRLARLAGAAADPEIVPFRGSYMRVKRSARELVRALIYPVPDLRLPFLGVHLTRTVRGEVLVGPTALPSLARDARAKLDLADAAASVAWPGAWRMARAQRRVAASELRFALSRRAFAAAAARYVPELRASDLERAPAGVRAQAVARDGTLVDDFVFAAGERSLHVRNAPSPAATGALAIAAVVAGRVEEELAGGLR